MERQNSKSSHQWSKSIAALNVLDDECTKCLNALSPSIIPKGTVLFRPGDTPKGFIFLLSGKVSVYLTGENGREILLYSITPGETCLQTTLGILGEEDYGGEAICESDVDAVLLPSNQFVELMDVSKSFREFIFKSFAQRLHGVTYLLEKVAFINVERRLAEALLERADQKNQVSITHQELAIAIGSAREVISRRLESFAKKGFVQLDRGVITLKNVTGLRVICENH